MVQKKDRSRFSIKFRENDPAHSMTIRILENQGQRNIAPFLVNAVLHYVQCTETPDVSHMLAENPPTSAISREAIEDIVKEILRQQGIIQEDSYKKEEINIFTREQVTKNKKEDIAAESIQPQNMVDDNMRAMIARTLSALRNE